MKAYVLRGSKQEIAEGLSRISGEVCEAIVFVDESAGGPAQTGTSEPEDLFAEMRRFMVDVPVVDDSRESIYTRMGSE